MSSQAKHCAHCGQDAYRIVCDECGADLTDTNDQFLVEISKRGGHPRRHAHYCAHCAARILPAFLTGPIGLLANRSTEDTNAAPF